MVRNSYERAVPLVAAAIAVSVVHYADNVVAYEAYPLSDTAPNPPAWLIAVSWFAFTAAAAAGLVLLRRGRRTAAALALAVYSGSGLVGMLHYTAGGTGEFPWWRHAHIVADIVLGAAVLAFALRLLAPPARPAEAGGDRRR